MNPKARLVLSQFQTSWCRTARATNTIKQTRTGFFMRISGSGKKRVPVGADYSTVPMAYRWVWLAT